MGIDQHCFLAGCMLWCDLQDNIGDIDVCAGKISIQEFNVCSSCGILAGNLSCREAHSLTIKDQVIVGHVGNIQRHHG